MFENLCTLYDLVGGKLFLFLGLTGILACNSVSDISTEAFLEENFKIEEVDSFSIQMATFLTDSLSTHNTDRLLIGHHQNTATGSLTASSFFKLNLDQSTPDIPQDNVIFDSMVLVLNYDDYYFYDTSRLMQISVFQLAEELLLDEESGALYNTSIVEISDLPIASKSFYPRPRGESSLEIKLPDNLGLEFFNLFLEEDEAVESNSKFQDYFKGLAILPNTANNSAIIGFSRSSQIRLYYSNLEELPKEQGVKTFSVEENENGVFLFFNQIKSNTSNTPFSLLEEDQTEIDADLTLDQSYIQAGAGWSVKISIPYIRNLLQVDESFILANATLVIRPVIERYDEQFELPPTLSVLWMDKNDDIFGQNNEPALLELDTEFGRDVKYNVDIKAFVDNQLASTENETNSLLVTLSTPALNSAVNQIIIGNANHKQKMELKLQLIDLKQ